MGWAIPVGFESRFEVAQVDLHSKISATDFVIAINGQLPAGIRVIDAKELSIGHKLNKHAKTQIVHFEMKAPMPLDKINERYQNNRIYKKVTPKKVKEINMDDYIKGFKISDGLLRVSYLQKDGGARIQDVIDALCALDNRTVLHYHPIITARNSDDNNKSIMEV